MTSRPQIPFNLPTRAATELAYVAQAFESGHTSASGEFARRAAQIIADDTGAAEVLMTTSCTSALELSGMLMDFQPGETVIVPSFTFSASALAFAREGARLIFCDIEPETLGLDPNHVAELLDDSVRAVVPVHYAGIGARMEALDEVLARRPDVAVIEDNAHGLFGTLNGRPLGGLGALATQSFHETKNFSCGEGGALVINDESYLDRARVLYDKGTNRRAFFLGQVDKYSWRDTGSSFGLSDLLAAGLTAQLEERKAIQGRRQEIFEQYAALLGPPADELGFTIPVVPAGREPAWHMFYLLLPDNPTRDRLLAELRENGIQATFHYVPLHSSKGGHRFAARETDCPVSTDVSGRLIRLPFHNHLSDGDVDRVADTVLEVLR
ncbi:MAG: dTDP-4-amino-4,6-dideoxygalactose transaminase [Actinomycetota bacterium]|nr:dTDP-4-amino-4,6-dideoxygalactose transaminase [Actinomycetota bacterium]